VLEFLSIAYSPNILAPFIIFIFDYQLTSPALQSRVSHARRNDRRVCAYTINLPSYRAGTGYCCVIAAG
jgi:hypothetical protein